MRGLPLVGLECVCPQCNNSPFVVTRGIRAMPSAMDLPVRITRSQELTRNGNNDILNSRKKHLQPFYIRVVNCPMIRPQRYSTLQKPISGYQPQVGSDRVALKNIAVRKLVKGKIIKIVVSLTTTQDLPRLLAVNNDCSAAASSPMSPQANPSPHVTPQIGHSTRRNPGHTWNVYFSTTSTRKTESSTPDMLCPYTASAMIRQLRLHQELPAPSPKLEGRKGGIQNSDKQNANNSKSKTPHKTST